MELISSPLSSKSFTARNALYCAASGERCPLGLIEVILCCPILEEIKKELGSVTHCSIVDKRSFERSSPVVYPFVSEGDLCILKKHHDVFIKAYLSNTF
jgi:NADH pyrophosphatase NudC (nudix superfamily)